MNNNKNFLITLSNGEYLIKVALQTKPEMFSGDALEYCLEPENKKQFLKLLPLHVQSFGSIVEIEEIFEVVAPLEK